MIPKKSDLFIRLLQRQKKKSAWIRLVCFLSVAVSIGVVFALMQPAITMDSELVCGLDEHTHSEACYELQDGEQVLVCGQTEHIHDENCCVPATVPEEPTIEYYCGFYYEHQHDPSCYADGELVCTMKQHVHSDACLDPSGQQPLQEESVTQNANSNQSLEQSLEQQPEQQPKRQRKQSLELPLESNEGINRSNALLMQQAPETEPELALQEVMYEDIREQDEANISFSIRVNGKDVNPNHFLGEAVYSLSITDAVLPSYDGTIFFVKLDSSGYDLYYGDKQSNGKLEDLTQEQPGSAGAVNYWAERDSNGFYTIYIQPKPDSEVVFRTNLMGMAISHREATDLEIDKVSAWDPGELAYKYDVTVNIPAYTNFFDQSYYIYDRTSISDVSYSPFSPASRGKNLAITITTGGVTTDLRPIQDVCDDPSVRVAYYEFRGVLYLMNRTEHADACLTTSPTTDYPGWCVCWSQPEESVIKISYIDAYAQNYYVQNINKPITNRAVVRGSEIGEVSSEVRDTIPALLKKEFDPIQRQCVITVNEDMCELSGPLVIKDEMDMSSAILNGAITVTSDNGTEKKTLSLDVDYTVAMQTDGFELTILNAGRYVYTITYNVGKRNESEVGVVASNSVRLKNITKTINMSFDYIVDSGSFGWSVSIIKTYGVDYAEDGTLLRCANPEEGAEFGLYEVNLDVDEDDGTLIATSKTEAGSRFIIREEGKKKLQSGQTIYTPGEEKDIITFNSDAGRYRVGRLFYLQETKAPLGYLADKTRYYFFITSHPEATTAVSPVLSYTANGVSYSVTLFDNWKLVPYASSPGVYYYVLSGKFLVGEAEQQIYNEKYRYVLPDTGGIGTAPYLFGGCFLLSAVCLYSLLSNRRKRRADRMS